MCCVPSPAQTNPVAPQAAQFASQAVGQSSGIQTNFTGHTRDGESLGGRSTAQIQTSSEYVPVLSSSNSSNLPKQQQQQHQFSQQQQQFSQQQQPPASWLLDQSKSELEESPCTSLTIGAGSCVATACPSRCSLALQVQD